MREAVTPLTKLLLNVKTDAILAFLNNFTLTWSLVKLGESHFRAEIRVPNELPFVGEHTHIPHNALARAMALFLTNANLDFHEYEGSE